MTYVRFEQRGAVAVITLNRPDRLNAISNALLADFQTAIERADRIADVRAVVLCGAGRAFCAGEDLKELDDVVRDEASVSKHVSAIQNVTRAMRRSQKIYITAAHGYAVGGGFEWMLGGDLVVVADELVAFFPEIERSLFPTGGVSWLLPLAMGYHRAMELMLLGERQSAARLMQLGLVNWVVPMSELMERAMEVAARIAAKPALSVSRFKKLLNEDLGPLGRALEFEEKYTIESFQQSGM